MALLFIDGFDHYSNIREKWVVGSPSEVPDFVAGRFGGQALRKQFQNASGSISHDFGAQSEVIFGLAFQAPGLQSRGMFRFLDSGSNSRCEVSLTTAGAVSVTAGGFINNSPDGVITTGTTWHYIECRYIAKASAGLGGVAEVRVDGVVVCAIDGALFPTTLGATDDIQQFEFSDSGTNSPRYLYDDLYIINGESAFNNAYLGDVRITVLYPESDGLDSDFTPSSGGDNFADVNETTLNGDTDYVESGTLMASEDYVNQDIGSDPGSIYGVQVSNGTRRTDAGSIRFKNEMRVASTKYSDDVEHVSNSGTYFIETYVRDTDPSDDAVWTESKVNAVGSGLTLTYTEVV